MERLHEITNGFIQAKILMAAAELRLFDRLDGESSTVETLVSSTGWDRRGLEILLDALVAMEILTKKDGVYTLVDVYAPFLTESAPTQFPALLRHRNRLFRYWAYLEERIKGDEPVAPDFKKKVVSETAANENFIRAMFSVGHENARVIADHVDFKDVGTIADLGGGPGHYLTEFLNRNESMDPYLVDLPQTLEVAGRLLAGTRFAGKISMIPWDFYSDNPPEGLPPLDMIYLSQVVHSSSPELNVALFKRIYPLMSPGGTLLIHENIVDRERTSPAAAALFAVNMLAMTEGGRTYTTDELFSWGREAGLEPGGGERIHDRSYLVRLHRR